MSKNLEQLIAEIELFRTERNWKQFHNLKDMIISLNLEASELLELVQWKSSEELLTAVKNNPSEIADELADIFYWLLIIANDTGIDLLSAFEKKMEQNKLKYPANKAFNSKDKYNKLN